MTGRLDIDWFEMGKFVPKLTRAAAEGFTVEDYGGGSDGLAAAAGAGARARSRGARAVSQLIRFGTAGQVYRPGELIIANRPRYPAPPPEPAPIAAAPALGGMTHAELDAELARRGLEAPTGWAKFTLAQKREWLGG